jgi:hypothetical protein
MGTIKGFSRTESGLSVPTQSSQLHLDVPVTAEAAAAFRACYFDSTNWELALFRPGCTPHLTLVSSFLPHSFVAD